MHGTFIDISRDANKVSYGVKTILPGKNTHPLIELNAADRAYKKVSGLQMIRSARPIAIALHICASLLLCITATTQSVSAAPLAGEENEAAVQIRAVLRAQQDAWNRGDIDGFMNGYAHSRSTVFVSEDSVRRGWGTVRARYKKKYSDRAKMGVLTFSDLEITALGSDAAVVLGRWQLKRAQDQPHGRFTLIFRKTAEGWRIAHDHTSAASPAK